MLTIREGMLELLRGEANETIDAETAFKLLQQDSGSVPRENEVKRLRLHETRAAVRILITKSVSGSHAFEATPSVRLDDKWMTLPSAWSPHVDHVIIGQDWCPLDQGSTDAIKALEIACGIRLRGPVTVGQLLKLRAQRDNAWVLEETSAILEAAEAIIDQRSLNAQLDHGIKLYPYQEQGVRWLVALTQQGLGGILADEMGLGKTVQIIALLKIIRLAETLRALVVGPTSILENWRRELAHFAPELRTLVHRGSGRTGRPSALLQYDVILCSYETAVRDEVLLRNIVWDVLVCDEAQALKNPDTARSQAMRRLRRKLSIAVTGTPLENRLLDLWSVFDFANPGLLGGRAPFEKSVDERTVDFVAAQTAPLVLRRRTASVARDLPALIDIPHFITMSEVEIDAYEAIRSASTKNAASRLGDLMRLQQYCSHPRLLDESVHEEDFSKLERAREIVEEIYANDEKVLVFAAYTRLIAWIRKQLGDHFQVPSWEITGATAPEARQDVVDEFSDHRGAGLLVLNPRAGGVGLNITAANHVIHYSAEWNPAVIDQATKRAHRRGQSKPVRVHRLLMAGTVDEVVNERLVRKRALAERAVQGTTAEGIAEQDLLRVFAISPIEVGHA